MHIEMLPGTANVVRFPVERRARPTLGLLREIAPDLREVLSIAEAFGLETPAPDLRDRVDAATAEYILNQFGGVGGPPAGALAALLDPVVARAITACCEWYACLSRRWLPPRRPRAWHARLAWRAGVSRGRRGTCAPTKRRCSARRPAGPDRASRSRSGFDNRLPRQRQAVDQAGSQRCYSRFLEPAGEPASLQPLRFRSLSRATAARSHSCSCASQPANSRSFSLAGGWRHAV